MSNGLTPFEEAHAKSITEPATIEPIPPLKKYNVLIGSVIRKPPVILAAFLECLAWQKLRTPMEVAYHLISDFAPSDPFAADSLTLLETFAKDHNATIEQHQGNSGGDYGEGPETRHWQATAWHRVGALKNRVLQRVLSEGFDACWLVDADVLTDPTTLQSLWDVDEQIVAGVYWTHWQRPDSGSAAVVHAGPQVWLRHPYVLSGRGYTEASFREALLRRGKVRVWGLGACTLLRRHAIEKGVNFAKVVELPPGPMSDGEDRHLCWKADRLHLSMWADAWPDIFHAYHPAQAGEIDRRLDQLQAAHPERAGVGDLVSAVVRNLEQLDVPAEWVRGRFGTLGVLPEIEEAIGGLTNGESRLLRVHFPVHYALPFLRGQTRLLHITLLDVKSYRLHPTIDEEILLGARSGSTLDVTTMSEPQLAEITA